MKRSAKPITISMKLILSATTALLVAGAVGAVSLVAQHNTRTVLQQEMDAKLVLEARNLALASSGPLLGAFPELTLCPLVREMTERQPSISMALVLDLDRRVQGHADARQLGQDFHLPDEFVPETPRVRLRDGEKLYGSEASVAVHVPVLHANGELLGSVIVEQRRDHLKGLLAAARRRELALAALFAVCGGLIAVVLMRRLLRPIDELRRGLERIGRGDLDEPIHMHDRTELGLLATNVNTMSGQLALSRREAEAKELEIVQTQRELIKTLGFVVEGRSNETANHTVRVGHMSALLASLAGLNEEEAELLRDAAPMHDVGKIGIPDAILNKPGKYTDEEMTMMKAHAALGHSILNHSERPLLRAAAIVAHEHHERWDGTGYPRGLRGERIHVYGRIVAIVDFFDAVTCNRVYRKAMPVPKVLDLMIEAREKHFDPTLLDIFLANVPKFLGLVEQFADVPPTESGTAPAATVLPGAPVADLAPQPAAEAVPVGLA